MLSATEDCGQSGQDLLSILLNGEINSEPEYDPKPDIGWTEIQGDAVAITVIVSSHI